MTTPQGFVVPAGGGTRFEMGAPGRFSDVKLVGRETNESVMMFEETLPAGTKSLFHLHRDSDEVAWVLEGEITFQIGDAVSVGGLAPARSFRATCSMRGRTRAARPAVCCSSTRRPRPAGTSRSSCAAAGSR